MFAQFFIDRPIFASVLSIILVIAGTISLAGLPIAQYPEDAFDETLAVHVRGAFLLAKHAVPYLSRGASIIFTSSVVGLTSAPHIAGYSTAGVQVDGADCAPAQLFKKADHCSNHACLENRSRP